MIACPICGAKTDVVETRGARRRRLCSRVGGCFGKVTTIEVVVDQPHRGPVVQVPRRQIGQLRRQIEQLREIVVALGGDRDRGA